MQSLGVARAMLFMALGISASQVLAAPVPAGDSSAQAPAVKAAPVPSAPSASAMLEVPQVTLEATTPAPQELTVAALTPVELEMRATVSSKVSHTGDIFPLRVTRPILVNGVTVVPAGAAAVGEVVHAKKSGGSGAAGELIVAARYVEIDGRRMRLRSLQLSTTGRDQTELAMASAQAISFLAFAIRGKNTEIPEGMHMTAKVAEPFIVALSPVPPADQPAAGLPPSTTGEKK